MNRYLNFRIPKEWLRKILEKHNKKKVIFYVDFLSVCKGLFKKDNIFFELQYYMENRNPSEKLIEEYRNFLNVLYKEFKQYSPFFVTFYDDGKNLQNRLIQNSYKDGRSAIKDIISSDDELNAYYKLKELNFEKLKNRFTVNDRGIVIYLKNYESDLIPHYIIKNNYFDSSSYDVLNVILSTDKDLLQTCQFKNTVQCTNRYFSSRGPNNRFQISVYNDYNAVSYIYDKFKPGGIITSKYIPLILSLAGDVADNIPGIKSIGKAKAISKIQNFNLPSNPDQFYQIENLPKILNDNISVIKNNYKMISFDEQIKRTTLNIYGLGGV